MKFTDIFKKLGAKYEIETEASMKRKASDNVAGYYDRRNDILHVMEEYKLDGPNDGLGFMGTAVANYVAMHELIHWTEKRVNRIWGTLKGILITGALQNAVMMEEVAAESGGEKLEKDLFHEDVSRGVAERLNVFVTHGMPTRYLDEGIKEGEKAAEYVEKELQNARPELHSA